MATSDERATRQQLCSDILAAGCRSAPEELELKSLPELNAMAAYWAAKVEGDELSMQRAMMAVNAASNAAERGRRTQLILNRSCLTAIIIGAVYVATGPDTEARGLVIGAAFVIAIVALFVWTDKIWKGGS